MTPAEQTVRWAIYDHFGSYNLSVDETLDIIDWLIEEIPGWAEKIKAAQIQKSEMQNPIR